MPSTPRLNYELAGPDHRPTLLYLHGFMGDLHDWDEIASLLGDSFRHLKVDLPGHGDTNPELPEDHYTMPQTAALIAGMLDHLSIRQCLLIGYSMGARLSLYLLTHYSDRFERAVVESGSPGLVTNAERSLRKAHDSELADRLLTEPLATFVEAWFNLSLFRTMDKSDPRFAAMIERRRRGRPDLFARSLLMLGTGAQASLWESLSDLALPTLFLTGEHDTKFAALAESMADLCPAGQTAIIRSAGHNTHFERPAEFATRVAKFFDRN